MVTTRRSTSARSPPVSELPTQRVYPVLTDAEESSNEDDEDDHEESSTTHPDPPKLNISTRSNSSFNSSSSSFNTSSLTAREFNCLYAFLGLFVVCIVYWLLSGRSHHEATREEFGKRLGAVLKGYPAISARDRIQLKAAADRWFDSSTKDPVVVIVYAPDSSFLLDELATSTASVLGRKTSVVTSTPSTARAHLHATFANTLKGGSKSTIGLREIEKLSWDAPLVLHSFADADHITASRPLIWLQVTRDDSLAGLSCDSAIESTLTSLWLASGGSVDNVAPVISRVLQFTVCLDWH